MWCLSNLFDFIFSYFNSSHIYFLFLYIRQKCVIKLYVKGPIFNNMQNCYDENIFFFCRKKERDIWNIWTYFYFPDIIINVLVSILCQFWKNQREYKNINMIYNI